MYASANGHASRLGVNQSPVAPQLIAVETAAAIGCVAGVGSDTAAQPANN